MKNFLKKTKALGHAIYKNFPEFIGAGMSLASYFCLSAGLKGSMKLYQEATDSVDVLGFLGLSLFAFFAALGSIYAFSKLFGTFMAETEFDYWRYKNL